MAFPRDPTPTQAAIEDAVVAWLRDRDLVLVRPIEAGRLQRDQRTASGAPNILVLVTPPCDPSSKGVAIKLHRPTGYRIKQRELEWMHRLAFLNFRTVVAFSVDEAVRSLGDLGWK